MRSPDFSSFNQKLKRISTKRDVQLAYFTAKIRK